MQTQEIYHAAKSFILTESNGPTVINALYDYVLFVYATHMRIENIIVNQKLKTKKHYSFHGTRNSFLSHCASQ